MRALGRRLGMRAPSLYKHLSGRPAIEEELRRAAWTELGILLRTRGGPGEDPRGRLLRTYRRAALAEPALYRLATSGNGPGPELRDWVLQPFIGLAGDRPGGLALWSLAHGLALLEIDGLLGGEARSAWGSAAGGVGPPTRAG